MRLVRGFTLVELIVTIAILGIVASIAAPSFSDQIQSYKSKQSIEQMVKALREGRSRAAAIKSSVVVCPSKNSSGQEITKQTCLTGAGVSASNTSKFTDSNRVLLANVDKSIGISGDTSFIFSATGSSIDGPESLTPIAKKITLCGNKAKIDISVSVIGSVISEKNGTCS